MMTHLDDGSDSPKRAPGPAQEGRAFLAASSTTTLSYVADSVEIICLSRGASSSSPEATRPSRFFIVRSGVIGIYRSVEGGRERELARYVAGDVIGDFDFAVGSPLDATARAEPASELVAFPRGGRRMQDLANEKPDASARILLRSLSMISSRLRSTQRLISENSPWVRELRRQIYTDPGTGLWSRAFLDEELHSQPREADRRRHGQARPASRSSTTRTATRRATRRWPSSRASSSARPSASAEAGPSACAATRRRSSLPDCGGRGRGGRRAQALRLDRQRWT